MTAADLTGEADRIRVSGIFGRSSSLRRLFDYLVAAAGDGVGCSEIDIAAAVFGKAGDVDLAQDATVRVYIHRLRTKLADFYAGEGRGSRLRLAIPRGHYRLVVETLPNVEDADIAADAALPPGRRLWTMVVAAAIMINFGVWAVAWPREPRGDLFAARNSAEWAPLLADSRPITVVVGDYYIFSETSPKRDTDRLVREYGINSPQALDDYLMANPEQMGRYHDLGLTYLPTSVSAALRDVIAVLVRSDDRKRVHVVVASQLSPETLRFTNVVYLGYLSGLGLLRDPVFAGSHLAPGATWDELIDRSTGHRFASNEGGPERANARSRGYGYLARFTGPSGNQVRIIAGTRDMALTGMAEAATRAVTLRTVDRLLAGVADGEALVQVDGVNREVLGEAVTKAWPRARQVWDARAVADVYPDG